MAFPLLSKEGARGSSVLQSMCLVSSVINPDPAAAGGLCSLLTVKQYHWLAGDNFDQRWYYNNLSNPLVISCV